MLQIAELLFLQEMTSNTFTTNDVSWQGQSVSTCNDSPFTEYNNASILGIFNQYTTLLKQVSNLSPHWSLSVRFDVCLYQVTNSYSVFKFNSDSSSPVEVVPSNTSTYKVCNQNKQENDEILYIYNNITHTSTSYTLSVVPIQQANAIQYFIKNFFIFIDTCHYSCASCTGPANDQCISCPQNGNLIGNKCNCNENYFSYNNECIPQCPNGYKKDLVNQSCIVDFSNVQNCLTCDGNQLCVGCQNGYYLLDGQCVNSCPNYTIQEQQKCKSLYFLNENAKVVFKSLYSQVFGVSEVLGSGFNLINYFGHFTQLPGTYVTYCDGQSILGGVQSKNGIIQKNILNMQFLSDIQCLSGPHWKISIGFYFISIDNYNNEDVLIKIDGIEKYKIQKQSNGQINRCGLTQHIEDVQQIQVDINQSSPDMLISIESNFSSQSSFGIREFFVYVHQCSPFCLECNQAGCLKCQPYYRLDTNDLQCKSCPPNCYTCRIQDNASYCTSCAGIYYFIFDQCQTYCPDGFYMNQEPNHNECKSCPIFCKTCDKEDNCLTCKNGLIKVGNTCKDCDRNCSTKDVAILNAFFSKTEPLLIIDFTKDIAFPNGFIPYVYSKLNCPVFFTDQTLTLIGPDSECGIRSTAIEVKYGRFFYQNQKKLNQYQSVLIDQNSQIANGDPIYFKKNTLSFSVYPNIKISTYLNNIIGQAQFIKLPKVIFDYQEIVYSCQDFKINFRKIVDDDGGFKQYSWVLKSIFPKDQKLQNRLEVLLQQVNTEQNLNLIIPAGLIKPNQNVTIMFQYTLKSNENNFEEFNLSSKPSVFLNIQSNIILPFYRYQNGFLVIESIVKYCGEIINEPLDLSITSQEFQDINYHNSSYQQQYFTYWLQPYKLQIGKTVINVVAKLASDPSIQQEIKQELYISQSFIIANIMSGGNQFDYKNEVIIKSQVRDFEIQNEKDFQGINLEWKSTNIANSNKCVDKLGNDIQFPQQPTISFKPFTFVPYTAIKLFLIGTKPIGRQATDSTIILFSEFDLPPVYVQINTLDPKQETVNLNEEINIDLRYGSSTNIDLLSFSGTIEYQNDVVGIIKLDYVQFRFQIWNYFSGFTRGFSDFSIRFSVFNPKYYMSSSYRKFLKLNFPPNNCKLDISPLMSGFSIETNYSIKFLGCQDDNQPIQYQFFYYKNYDEFEYEKKNSIQVKRRQLNDKSLNSILDTLLPQGKILILAQAIDSKQAIYNETISLDVKFKKYDEQSYLQIIQNQLEQINKAQANNIIPNLLIICDDILQRPEFKSSALLNSKKIEIITQLNILQNNLSPLSSLSTSVDKAIISLIESGIIQNQYQSNEMLSQQIVSLDQASNLQQFNLNLSKEKLKQKLYDNFQLIDNINHSEQFTQSGNQIIEMTDKIGNYLYKDILPNEDPIYFDGKQMSIYGAQITEKHMCTYFLCGNLHSQENNKQTSIYNFKQQKYTNNPYQQDDSFIKYIDQLKVAQPDLSLKSFPVITPSMIIHENNDLNLKNESNNQISTLNKKIMITFPNQEIDSSSKALTCLTKNQGKGWINQGCQNVYDQDSKSYMCFCDELSPTTVVNDLEQLLNNKNINTAFSSDGISNITHFKDFYQYVIFWTLLLKTVLFFILYLNGQKQDSLDSTKEKLEKIEYLAISKSPSSIKNTKYSKSKVIPLDEDRNNQYLNDNLQNKSPQFRQSISTNQNSPQFLLQNDKIIQKNMEIMDLNNTQGYPIFKSFDKQNKSNIQLIATNQQKYDQSSNQSQNLENIISNQNIASNQNIDIPQNVFKFRKSSQLTNVPQTPDKISSSEQGENALTFCQNEKNQKTNWQVCQNSDQVNDEVKFILTEENLTKFYNLNNNQGLEQQDQIVNISSCLKDLNLQKNELNNKDVNLKDNKKDKQGKIISKNSVNTKTFEDKNSVQKLELISNHDTESKNLNNQYTINTKQEKELLSEQIMSEKEDKAQQKKSDKNKLFKFYAGFNELPTYKQVFIFHNFFSIFYVFNPNLSRTLRFFIFYLRCIHSIGISVIFDEQYSSTQQILVAVINAITIFVVVKLLEVGFSLKMKIALVITRILSILIILTYFYVILSIVSGKTSTESNKSIILFLIIFSADLFAFSFLFAFGLRFIAQFVLQNKYNNKNMEKLQKFLELNLILASVVLK